MELPSVHRIFCNTCKTRTNHELEAFHERFFVDLDLAPGAAIDEAEEYEKWKYYLWVCRGCDTATLQEDYTSHLTKPKEAYEATFYPKRQKDSLSFKIFIRLDQKLSTIYPEVITSFNHDARILCAVGPRALLEGICAEKGIEGRNLYNNSEDMMLGRCRIKE